MIKRDEILDLFTSESVTEGHPDKMADQISDNILDAILEQDKNSRVACETFITNNNIIIGGEVTTNAVVDYEQIARDTIKEIGFTKDEYGVTDKTYNIQILLSKQSPEINQGVDLENGELGAGDQGIIFGYATNETDNYMPFAINYAHKLASRLAYIRKNNIVNYLRPDGKTQVTIEYDKNKKVKRISSVVISAQHDDNIHLDQIKEDLIEHVIKKELPNHLLDKDTEYHINPTGSFIIGGSIGDAGLTGRKIIVDTYGGSAAHGGGAFSGKDYTKVDRSAAYMARYLAKNIVASGICDRIQIQIGYVIGISEPVSISIDTFNTNKVDEDIIIETIFNNFDLTPSGILNKLNLYQPIYKKTATYGHFGKEDFMWEKLDSVEVFKKLI